MTAPLVFPTMGTTASVTTAEPLTEPLAARLQNVCEAYDRRFSLYREDSEASRLNRRELLLPDASATTQRTYELASMWRDATEGAFTPHRPDGVLDLAGVVKAMAIRDVGSALDDAGLADWCVNIGGDVLTRGTDLARGHSWTVGIVDPAERTQLLSQVRCSLSTAAVCTSGTSERGEHIWRLSGGDNFCQVTVAASDIVIADVCATAVLAGGHRTLELVTSRWPVQVLAVGHDGALWGTGAFRTPLRVG